MEMLSARRFDQLEQQLLYPQPVVGSRPRRVLFFSSFPCCAMHNASKPIVGSCASGGKFLLGEQAHVEGWA